MRNVLWLRANGTEAQMEANRDLELDDMQALVGGPIELWPERVDYHGASLQMVVNEEARIKYPRHVNKKATALARRRVFGNAFVGLDGDVQ